MENTYNSLNLAQIEKVLNIHKNGGERRTVAGERGKVDTPPDLLGVLIVKG